VSSWKYLCSDISFKEFMNCNYHDDNKDNYDIMKSYTEDELYNIYRNNKSNIHYKIWKINKCVYHTQPMVDAITDENGKIKMNYIGLTETLDDDLQFVLNKNNIKICGNVMKLNKRDGKYELTEEDKKLIMVRYEYDIKLFELIKSLSNEERLNYDYNKIFN